MRLDAHLGDELFSDHNPRIDAVPTDSADSMRLRSGGSARSSRRHYGYVYEVGTRESVRVAQYDERLCQRTID